MSPYSGARDSSTCGESCRINARDEISLRLQLCVPSKHAATSFRRCSGGSSPFWRPFDQPSLCSFYARPSRSFATSPSTHQRVYNNAGSSAVSSVLAAWSVQRGTEWTCWRSCSAADGPSRARSRRVWRTGVDGSSTTTAAVTAGPGCFFALCRPSCWNDVVCVACFAAAERDRRRLGQEGRDQQAGAGGERRSR